MTDTFIMRWIAATVPGFAAGGVLWSLLAAITGYLNGPESYLDWIVPLSSIAVAGVISGLGQARFLLKTSEVTITHWASATAIGTLAGLLAVGFIASQVSGVRLGMNFAASGALLSIPYNSFTSGGNWSPMLLGGAIFFLYFGCLYAFFIAGAGGLMTGTIQAIVLRHRVRPYLMWPLTSMLVYSGSGVTRVIVSWICGMAAGGPPNVLQNWFILVPLGIIVWAAMGTVVAVLSAPAMTWLLREPYEEGTLF